MLKEMKTGTKLACSFGAIVLLMVVTAMLTVWQVHQINRSVSSVIDDRAVKLAIADEIEDRVSLQMSDLRNAIIASGDAREVSASLERVERAAVENAQTLARLEKLLKSQIGRELFAGIMAARITYTNGRNDVVALVKAGKFDEAGRHLLQKVRPAQDNFLAAIGAFTAMQTKLMAEAGAEAKRAGARAIQVTVGLAALGALLAVVVGFGITRSLMRELGGEPADAKRIAAAIAEGDLTRPVPVKPGDETSLAAQLATMQASLQQIASSVRQNSESVATASAQIAQGNLDLSSRTEQQASALQQAASTMEQLGTTVRSNADSARQANQVAQGASAVASQGGEVVGKVVSTMQGISESSRKIGDIIGVIDGIAFQTNILALNAAVEAARAGEQGRGFAVVAAEVRSLAQRSAEAAKEIKALIGRSVEQVEQGTSLVGEAGQTMGEIVSSIRRVSDIVAEISSASTEQSAGVQQVGESVSQMDHATQQNAALVEENAAAAESLKGQAQNLVNAMATFRLSNSKVASAA